MSGHLLAQSLLLFLLVYADFTSSKEHYIMITPSLDSPCPQNASSCLTLSQFAVNSSHNKTDTSLLFLPGNHTLDQELLLAHGHNFSMNKYAKDNETVFIECTSQLGRFDISEAISASIKGLHFIGCGSNKVSNVTWLTIADSTFQDVKDKNTVLVISGVYAANIVSSQFHHNTLKHYDTFSLSFISVLKRLDYIYHQENISTGVLYTAYSNVSIIVGCRFMHNRADVGGALVAHNSSLHIDESAYINNTANFGGVMVTSESMLDIENTVFTDNLAKYGGVMVTYNERVCITSTTFIRNNANRASGVLMTYGNSSFTIKNSNFISNSARRGDVLFTTGNSSFTIINSNFTSNGATNGGVMETHYGNSSITINNSSFTCNSANNGGVMTTYRKSSIVYSLTITPLSLVEYFSAQKEK